MAWPITSGRLPAAMMVSIPARQATSAACSLVPMPPVPSPETLSRGDGAQRVVDAVNVFNQLRLRVAARVGGEQAWLVG